MEKTIPVTIRMSAEKAKIYQQLAKSEERSRNYLMNRALDRYLEMHLSWANGIDQAIKEVESSNVRSLEAVAGQLDDEFNV